MNRQLHHITFILLGFSFFTGTSHAQVPSTSIEAIDAFYLESSKSNFEPDRFFSEQAFTQVVQYNEQGAPKVISYTPREYADQVDTLVKLFEVKQEPVVILSRYYGHLATAYLSVYTQLIDKKSQDTLRLRSMHAMQWVKRDDWKIVSLVIQNEVGGFAIEQELWPLGLTKEIALGINATKRVPAASSDDLETAYDPSKVYSLDDVEVEPSYPGDPSLYTSLLSTFEVSEDSSSEGSPFTVIIEEDGLAQLGYVGDLSGAQIETAKSFVQSMLIWYPGIKDEASVRTKLIYYLQ